MPRTKPTNVFASRVKRGDSLTNITGHVAKVEIKGKDVLITMSSGDMTFYRLNEIVTVNRPV
jgi:hypothetical protein